MTASTLRKLPGGCYAVTLALPPDIAEFAMNECQTRGYEDADAYLRCVLNTAMFQEMCEEPAHAAVPPFWGAEDDDIPF